MRFWRCCFKGNRSGQKMLEISVLEMAGLTPIGSPSTCQWKPVYNVPTLLSASRDPDFLLTRIYCLKVLVSLWHGEQEMSYQCKIFPKMPSWPNLLFLSGMKAAVLPNIMSGRIYYPLSRGLLLCVFPVMVISSGVQPCCDSLPKNPPSLNNRRDVLRLVSGTSV